MAALGSLFPLADFDITTCACDTSEDGWRPCPSSLCERPDHDHTTCPRVGRIRTEGGTVAHERVPYDQPQTWYFTFGVGDPQFAGQFYVIEGVGGAEARDRMVEVFGRKWAFQYDEADWFKHGVSQAEKYGLTEIPQ